MRMKKTVQMICWQRLKTKKSTKVHRSIGPFLFCTFSVWFRFSIYLHTQCFMQRKIIYYMYCVCCEHTNIDPMKEKVDMRWRWLIALCLARIQQFFEQHVGISCNDREILDKIGYAQKTAAATTTKTSIIGDFWVIFLRISHHYRWIILAQFLKQFQMKLIAAHTSIENDMDPFISGCLLQFYFCSLFFFIICWQFCLFWLKFILNENAFAHGNPNLLYCVYYCT